MATRSERKKANLALFGFDGAMERKEDRAMVAMVLGRSERAEVRNFSRHLTAPANEKVSLVSLAENFQLSYMELAKIYHDIKKAEGFVRIANHLPDLMEQTALEAKSEMAACKKCGGSGEITKTLKMGEESSQVTEPCGECGGTGEVWEVGDIDRLKLIFETAKLTGNGKGNQMMNLNIANVTTDEKMEDLIGSLPQVIEGNKQ